MEYHRYYIFKQLYFYYTSTDNIVGRNFDDECHIVNGLTNLTFLWVYMQA